MVRNYLSVDRMFKSLKANRKSALEFMTGEMLHRRLCKFNQTSDWQCRPLRKAQLHYAAMDAIVLSKIFLKLKIEAEKIGEGDDIVWIEDSFV